MTQMPTVIVKKGGFLSACVYSVFGFLTTCVVCGSGLGVYWMNIADRHLGQIVQAGGDVLKSLPQWRENLPPALSDAVDDRRAPEYRQELQIKTRLANSADRHGRRRAVVEITNTGAEVVSVLALNVRVQDDDGIPVGRFIAYAATPLTIDADQWPGAILPGSKREIVRWVDGAGEAEAVSVEVTELRVARKPVQHDEPTTASVK